MSSSILFTGATGYLGRHLVKHFSDAGFEVFALIRKTSNTSLLREINSEIKFITKEELSNLGKIDIFLHTATAYGRKGESEDEIFKTNIELPLSILKSIHHPNLLVVNTDTSLPKGLNAYSTSKKEFVERLHLDFGELKIANLICEQFYGPSDGTFLTFIKKSLEKGEPIEMTDGTQKRDFLFIEDLVKAYDLIISKLEELSFGVNDFEVGLGKSYSIQDITLLATEVLEGNPNLFRWGAKPMRENEVMDSVADISKLSKLGWKPQYSLKEGMAKTYKS